MASVGSIPVVERLHSFVSARLDMLKEAYQPQDRLLRIHRHWVITALSQILNKESNKQNEKELLDALIDFFKTQSTLITYTAAPDSLLVSLYCSIAVVTAQTANRTNPLSDPHNKPVGVLNLLMPALRNTEALSAEYPELQPRWDEEQKKWLVVDAPSLDIRKILKQHIISSNRLYLLPVRAVCHYITDSFVNDPICNVYFNDLQCENFDTDLYLTEDEITRISQHSELTQSFFAAKKAHIRYGEDSPTLLGALIELREALRKSSKQGEGNEYHADPTILLATRKCKNFVDGLTAVQRQAIPPDLSQQLNELFQLSDLLPDDGKGKTNCTDIIGNTIGRFIETYNELLQNIEGYPANSFLPALRKARQALLQALDDGSYCGCDNLLLITGQMTALLAHCLTPTMLADITDYEEYIKILGREQVFGYIEKNNPDILSHLLTLSLRRLKGQYTTQVHFLDILYIKSLGNELDGIPACGRTPEAIVSYFMESYRIGLTASMALKCIVPIHFLLIILAENPSNIAIQRHAMAIIEFLVLQPEHSINGRFESFLHDVSLLANYFKNTEKAFRVFNKRQQVQFIVGALKDMKGHFGKIILMHILVDYLLRMGSQKLFHSVLDELSFYEYDTLRESLFDKLGEVRILELETRAPYKNGASFVEINHIQSLVGLLNREQRVSVLEFYFQGLFERIACWVNSDIHKAEEKVDWDDFVEMIRVLARLPENNLFINCRSGHFFSNYNTIHDDLIMGFYWDLLAAYLNAASPNVLQQQQPFFIKVLACLIARSIRANVEGKFKEDASLKLSGFDRFVHALDFNNPLIRALVISAMNANQPFFIECIKSKVSMYAQKELKVSLAFILSSFYFSDFREVGCDRIALFVRHRWLLFQSGILEAILVEPIISIQSRKDLLADIRKMPDADLRHFLDGIHTDKLLRFVQTFQDLRDLAGFLSEDKYEALSNQFKERFITAYNVALNSSRFFPSPFSKKWTNAANLREIEDHIEQDADSRSAKVLRTIAWTEDPIYLKGL